MGNDVVNGGHVRFMVRCFGPSDSACDIASVEVERERAGRRVVLGLDH